MNGWRNRKPSYEKKKNVLSLKIGLPKARNQMESARIEDELLAKRNEHHDRWGGEWGNSEPL